MKQIISVSLVLILAACSSKDTRVLPYIGYHEVVKVADGTHDIGDTIFDAIDEDFTFLTQDSSTFTRQDLNGKISVAKFFFTHCPTICPPMTGQMDKLVNKMQDISDKVQFLSISIDPDRDTVNRLRIYRDRYEITAENWFFLTGEKEAYVHKLGTQSFFVNALNDENAEGGYAHSPHFVLIDRDRHVRGLYDVLEKNGKGAENLKRLEEDIRKLLKLEYGEKI